MLSIHFLNVDHGDSIVIEHNADGVRSFAVIDSNLGASKVPKCLAKLRQLGCTNLNFVTLTHPHSDHFMGLSALLAEYDGRLDTFFSFPIDRSNLRKIAEGISSKLDASDDSEYSASVEELISVFVHAQRMDKLSSWELLEGYSKDLMPTGFNGVKFTAILPPAKIKGAKVFNDINSGQFDLREAHPNSVSIALLIEYAGRQIVLGGDGTFDNWMDLRRVMERSGRKLSPSIVKLPHHGSKHDCSDDVLDFLFAERPHGITPIACISANGKTHPSPDVLDALRVRGIHPYCSNLANTCGADAVAILEAGDCDPSLARYLNSVTTGAGVSGSKRPCQGDVVISIADDGGVIPKTEFKHLCPYRGDYAAFLGDTFGAVSD